MTSVIACNSTGSYVELPPPAYQGYSAIWEELNQADRNVLGNLIKKRITTKYTIELEWHAVTAEQKNAIISSTNANKFSVRFLSLMDDAVTYADCYRGSAPEITGYGRFDGTTFQYYDVKISLVEF